MKVPAGEPLSLGELVLVEGTNATVCLARCRG